MSISEFPKEAILEWRRNPPAAPSLEDIPGLCKDIELLRNWLDWLQGRCLKQNPVAGRLYVLKSHHGRFVTLDHRNRLVASSADRGEAIRLALEECDDQQFVLGLPNQRYVKVMPGLELTADAANQETATRFALLRLGAGKVSFYYQKGDVYKFVSARDGSQGWDVRAEMRWCEKWEWFDVLPCDPQLQPVPRTLGARLDGLEDILRTGVPVELKSLCDQQLAAIDERMTALSALETRVRELVKNHAD